MARQNAGNKPVGNHGACRETASGTKSIPAMYNIEKLKWPSQSHGEPRC